MSKTIFGINTRFKIKNYLEDCNSNILLLRTKNSFLINGGSDLIKKINLGEKIKEFYNFSNDVKLSDALKVFDFFKKKRCKVIIAIGGGSVLDMAKIIKFFANHKGKINHDILRKDFTNKKIKNKIPIIALPTTAGTGSEETHFATIYHRKVKYSVSNLSLRPDISIIDPFFTFSVPKYITASTAFDSLCQAIESFWSKGANSESEKYSLKAIKLIFDNIKNACRGERRSKVQMSKASNLSGKAINISKTTAPHALSYGINQILGVPHGHAVAITLGKFFKINKSRYQSKNDSKKLKKIFYFFNVKSANEAEKKWYKLMADCGLETNFEKLGLKNSLNIKKILKKVNIDRLKNHPVTLNLNDLKNLFID